MNKITHNSVSESGNIIFLILVAVALFSGLSYVVSSNSRTSGSGVGNETTLIATSELIQYASILENALTFLKVSKRCAANEISFERSPFDGSDTDYVNPSAPSDFSCHVFHPIGGRAAARAVPINTNDGRDWAYIEARVLGIGANQTACGIDCNEILLVLGGLREGTCQKINKKLVGSVSIPVQDDGKDYEDKKYTGSFTSGADFDGGATRISSLCTEDANGTYYYYHVLLPR